MGSVPRFPGFPRFLREPDVERATGSEQMKICPYLRDLPCGRSAESGKSGLRKEK
jgi:hypothetical protein